jgi:hypothetical protein
MSLPRLGVLSYNGYEFPSETKTVSVDCRPIKDLAGRTIVQRNYSFQFEAWIVAGDDQGTTLADIRNRLNKQGGEFVYSDHGYGDIRVNTASGERDVAYGPIPTILRWSPTGGNRAAKILWQIDFALKPCEDASDQNEIMELVYKVTYNHDYAGYTTKTLSGYLRIPATRRSVDDKTVPDSADDYFERVFPPYPDDCKRTVNQRVLDESRTRLDFTFTDEELPVTLPEGMANATGSHVLTANTQAFSRWSGSISVSLEVGAGLSRSRSWREFARILKDRLEAERTQLQAQAKLTPSNVIATIPLAMTISEPQMFGREAGSFSFQYQHVGGEFLFPLGGLWRPVPGSPEKWAQSLATSARKPRGNADHRFRASDDAIVDLCLGSSSTPSNKAGTASNPISTTQQNALRSQYFPADTEWEILLEAMGTPDQLTAEQSWLQYEISLVVEPIDYNIEHRPTPISGPSIFPGGPLAINSIPDNASIIQSLNSPSFIVRLVGRAIRVGELIEPPVLERVGDAIAIPQNHPDHGCYFANALVGYTSHPIYAAKWNLRFIVAKGNFSPPMQPYGKMPPPPTPPTFQQP